MSVLHITDKEFDSVISSKDKPVLVDFWAEWCMPCKMFAPVIDKLDAEIGDRAVIAKVNIDECEELASQYRIMSIPTVVIFRNGEEEQRFGGAKSAGEIKNQRGRGCAEVQRDFSRVCDMRTFYEKSLTNLEIRYIIKK